MTRTSYRRRTCSSNLIDDNKEFTSKCAGRARNRARSTRTSATTSLLEVYIDESERRTWFLFEASRNADGSGH